MTIEMFLVGVMWRLWKQCDFPTSPRDRGFVCPMQMLVNDGMSLQSAHDDRAIDPEVRWIDTRCLVLNH